MKSTFAIVLFCALCVLPAQGAIDVIRGTTTNATAGSPFIGFFILTGGTPTDDCTIISNYSFMCSLSAASNGTILTVTGTPVFPGTGNMEIRVPTNTGLATKTYFLTVASPVTLTQSSSTDPVTRIIGSQYDAGWRLQGGTGVITYSITSGVVPPGTQLMAGGYLQGTLLVPGTFTFTVTAVDKWGSSGSLTQTVLVTPYPPLAFKLPEPPPSGIVGGSYYCVLPTENSTPPLTWSVSSGALPPGVMLGHSSGVLTGWPSASGSNTFTVSVTDSGDPPQTVSQKFTINIDPPIQLVVTSGYPLPVGRIGQPYSARLTASGGPAPYTWSSEKLPAGLLLSPDGVISGTPSAIGTQSFSVRVNDSQGHTAQGNFNLVVLDLLATQALPDGTVGDVYGGIIYRFVRFPVPQNIYPFSDWFVAEGQLPAGLTILQSGALEGTPRLSGTYKFVIQFSDVFRNPIQQSFSLTINPAPGVFQYAVKNRGLQLVTSGMEAPALRVGYARVVPDRAQITPSGVAFIQLRSADGLVSETAVPAVQPMTNGRLFAEVTPDINTGIAIVNSNNLEVGITLSYVDLNGSNLGKTSLNIGAHQQIAAFLNQAPFNGPSSWNGTVTITSNLPVAILALRAFTNERSDVLFTSLPVSPVQTVRGTTLVPQFVAGGGWSTQLILINPTGEVLTGVAEFIESGSSAMSVNYSIPSNSAQKLTIPASGDTVLTGSVRLTPEFPSSTPSGLLIYDFKQGGVTISETGLIFGRVGEKFQVPVENSQQSSLRTGFALANNSPNPITVTLQVAGSDGNLMGTASMDLPGNGQIARYVDEIPKLETPSEFHGLLIVSAPNPAIAMTAIRVHHNERGDYILAAVPPVDSFAGSVESEKVFPHLVNGEGYSTAIRLFSGVEGEFGTGFLRTLSPDGVPADLSLRLDKE